MGNIFRKTLDMSQKVAKIEIYEGRLLDRGGRHPAVVVTSRKGDVYRIEPEPGDENNSRYRQICRKGNYRIVLVPKGELYNGEWSHVETVKQMSAYLKLQHLLDAACQDPSGEGSDQMVSRVRAAAMPKWFEKWGLFIAVVCTILAGIQIAAFLVIYCWPVVIFIALITLIVRLADSKPNKLKLSVGIACFVCYYYSTSVFMIMQQCLGVRNFKSRTMYEYLTLSE